MLFVSIALNIADSAVVHGKGNKYPENSQKNAAPSDVGGAAFFGMDVIIV